LARDDVLVIGGGVIGTCCAHELVARGRRVRIVEAGEICAGSSYGNAGLILPSHSVPLPSPGALGEGLRFLLDRESPFYIKPRASLDLVRWLVRFAAHSNERHVARAMPVLHGLARESLSLYEAHAKQLDFGLERCGHLQLFRTHAGLEGGVHEASRLASLGVESSVLDARAVREREPCAGPIVVGGVLYPGDATLQPAAFVRALARSLEGRGVTLQTHTEVLGFELRGGRVMRVETTRGDFEPDEVVLAAGAWSPRLAKPLGLRLPIEPAKGYSVTVERPASCPRHALLLGESRVGVTPMGATLRFAGTLELAGLDLSIDRRRVNAIVRAAREFLPALEETPLIEIWRGLRPCTPDGLPIVGRAPRLENLWLATGHGMLGMAHGPITGKLVAELLTGAEPSLDPSALRPERFR
jgi:D-amino-acid dehydrogenase